MVMFNGGMPAGVDVGGTTGGLADLPWRSPRDAKKDKRLHVRFYRDVIGMKYWSEQERKQRTVTADFIEVRMDEYSTFGLEIGFVKTPTGYAEINGKRIPTEDRKHWTSSFPEQWEEYQMTMGGEHGTPIAELRDTFPISMGDIAEMNYYGIHSVEAFANVSNRLLTDMGLQECGQSYEDLRDQVIVWLKERGVSAALTEQAAKAEAERDAAVAESAALRAKLEELTALKTEERREKGKKMKHGGMQGKPITDPDGVPLSRSK